MKLISLLINNEIKYHCIDYEDLELEIIIIHDKNNHEINKYPLFKSEIIDKELRLTILEETKI